MAVSVNINNNYNQYNNTVTQSTTQQGVPVNNQQSVINSGLQILKEMLAGDTFTGRVMGLEDGNVLINMNNGKSLLAHLSDNATVQMGQNMTFMVEDNNGSNIVIKPLISDEQQSLLINRALDAAQFPATDANIAIVNELLKLNMPINADTIADMVKHTTKFPEANINTIANLVKLDIPVTENNIAQFEAYKSYEHSINHELNDMVDGFVKLIQGGKGEGFFSSQPAAAFSEIVNLLYDNDVNSGVGQRPSATVADTLGQDGVDNLTKLFDSAKEQLALNGNNPEVIDSLANSLKGGKITVKQFFNDISTIIKDNPSLTRELSEALDSDEFSKLIKQMIDETMKLNPQDVSKEDGIKKYYKRMDEITDKISEKLAGSGAGEQLSADMDSIKSNIDFMNDLNKNMTYFQMPIKLQHGDANGELYVFTNKRALKAGSDNVSALLHLDMDNLGPVDVYVKLAGVNVSTNFCLESEEMLDFVYSHIDKLNKRLQSLGYNCHFDMKVSESVETGKPSFDFVKDFIEKDTSTMATTQYVLDVKA